MAKQIEILWHQDKKCVYLSYQIMDAKNANVVFNGNNVEFSCSDAKGVKYQSSIQCFQEFLAEESSWKVLGREVTVKLTKKETLTWPKLVKEGKFNNIKHNWSYPVYDSDDENEELGNPNFDFGGMGGMDNFGDYGDEEPGDLGNSSESEDESADVNQENAQAEVDKQAA